MALSFPSARDTEVGGPLIPSRMLEILIPVARAFVFFSYIVRFLRLDSCLDRSARYPSLFPSAVRDARSRCVVNRHVS